MSNNASCLSLENLLRDLKQNRKQVVKSLLARTVSRAIDIDYEPGKTAWRKVFQYYKNHELKGESLETEVQLFNKTSPIYLTVPVYLLAETFGALISVALIGFVPSRNIAGPIYEFFTRTHIRQRLAA